jgi:hypothetical protein
VRFETCNNAFSPRQFLAVALLPCVSRRYAVAFPPLPVGGTVLPQLLARQCLVSVKQSVPWKVKVGSCIGEAVGEASLPFIPRTLL